jgi:hypothetical protein
MESSILTKRDAQLTKRIMRRIYLISAIRLAIHPMTLKIVLAALLFVRSMKYVSYAHVLENMASLTNTSAGIGFAKAAMLNAHPMTLVLLSSVVWLGVWVVADSFFRKNEAWI